MYIYCECYYDTIINYITSSFLNSYNAQLKNRFTFQLDHVHHQNSTPKCTDSDSGGESTPAPDHHKVTAGHDEEEEHKPFPTLVEAFNNVSEEVGFNVEVKYPMVTVVCFSIGS